MNNEKIVINGVTYVPEPSGEASTADGLPYVMVRTYSAGVFAGYLSSRTGQEVVMKNARRMWYWTGAASLSQLATDGTASPEDCKFPCAVAEVTLLQVIEIIPITDKAKKSIDEVAVWQS